MSMFSRLRVVIRDKVHACKPYSNSAHSFWVFVFMPDFTFFKAFPCMPPQGPGGGLIYGETEVPQGTYLVTAIASCGNVWTNWAWVQVCCDSVACVNLLARTKAQCIYDAVIGIKQWLLEDQKMNPEARKAADVVIKALTDVKKHLPDQRPFSLKGALPALREAKAPADILKMLEEDA